MRCVTNKGKIRLRSLRVPQSLVSCLVQKAKDQGRERTFSRPFVTKQNAWLVVDNSLRLRTLYDPYAYVMC